MAGGQHSWQTVREKEIEVCCCDWSDGCSIICASTGFYTERLPIRAPADSSTLDFTTDMHTTSGLMQLNSGRHSALINVVKTVKAEYSYSWESISELLGVTCHMGSHRVTCHPTQVNAPRYNLSQPGRYSIYLPRRDGRLSWPIGSLLTARPGIEPTTAWSQVRRPNRYATKSH